MRVLEFQFEAIDAPGVSGYCQCATADGVTIYGVFEVYYVDVRIGVQETRGIRQYKG